MDGQTDRQAGRRADRQIEDLVQNFLTTFENECSYYSFELSHRDGQWIRQTWQCHSRASHLAVAEFICPPVVDTTVVVPERFIPVESIWSKREKLARETAATAHVGVDQYVVRSSYCRLD